MTVVLWATFGLTTGAAVLHAALGLARPPDRTYLSFACLMAMLAAFVFYERELYVSPTPEAAVETVRRQILAGHGVLASILVFVPAYTRVRVPRWIILAYVAGLTALLLTNLLAPLGIWFSAPPRLEPSRFRGEPFTAVVAPSLTPLQVVHTLYVVAMFVLMFSCAVKVVRRGERQRGAMLGLSLCLAIVPHVVDVVRDATGGAWPNVAEFGLVMWGLIMSVQLAIDYRVSEQRLFATLTAAEQRAAELVSMVEATLRVRDTLNTPLQTLEFSLAARTPGKPEDVAALSALRGAVRQLTLLGRAVEHTTDQLHNGMAEQERGP